MSELSFKYCPVCGEKLEYGKISVPPPRTLTGDILFYSEENIEYRNKSCLRKEFLSNYSKITYFAMFKQPCIPAGYCEKCDRIFAEIEMREKYNPIGEDTIPTYDEDYYCEDNDSMISEENISVQENDPYEEWNSLIDWDNFDEK